MGSRQLKRLQGKRNDGAAWRPARLWAPLVLASIASLGLSSCEDSARNAAGLLAVHGLDGIYYNQFRLLVGHAGQNNFQRCFGQDI